MAGRKKGTATLVLPDRSKAFAAEMCSARSSLAWALPPDHKLSPRGFTISREHVLAMTSHRPRVGRESSTPASAANPSVQCTAGTGASLENGREAVAGGSIVMSQAPVGEEFTAGGDYGAAAASTTVAEAVATTAADTSGEQGADPAQAEGLFEEGGKGACETDDGPSGGFLCGVLGCTKRHGHPGVCDVRVDVALGNRTRKLPKWREVRPTAHPSLTAHPSPAAHPSCCCIHPVADCGASRPSMWC